MVRSEDVGVYFAFQKCKIFVLDLGSIVIPGCSLGRELASDPRRRLDGCRRPEDVSVDDCTNLRREFVEECGRVLCSGWSA